MKYLQTAGITSEGAAIHEGRRDRGICQVHAEDMDHLKLSAEARKQIEKEDAVTSLPCVQRKRHRGSDDPHCTYSYDA